MEFDTVLEVLRALEAKGVEYAVVGGVAINFHGLARATVDLDLFVAGGEDNVDRLKAALKSVFDDPAIDGITAEDLSGVYPAIQYVPPQGEFHVDILTRLGDAFGYADIETETIEIGGVKARVATPRMLFRMKHDTVRLRDRADAERLQQRFGPFDEDPGDA